MILSDRTLREQLDAGRIVIEPLGPNSLQPSSVDLRLDRFFRVFKNHTMGHIDVKQNLEELTELVEVGVARSRSSCIRVSSCSARPSNGPQCPTIWSPVSRASRRSVGSDC